MSFSGIGIGIGYGLNPKGKSSALLKILQEKPTGYILNYFPTQRSFQSNQQILQNADFNGDVSDKLTFAQLSLRISKLLKQPY